MFDCQNRYGELCPQQEKALEELGIPLPLPDKPKGKNNNRKQTFDAVCRTILFDISRKHGVHLEQEPSYGGRAYLEKQDYILLKQKEQLAAQSQALEIQQKQISQQDSYIQFQDRVLHSVEAEVGRQEKKLEKLTLKVEDVETLIDEVSDVAYDKAVEVVTDKVQEQTQLEDLVVIEKYPKAVTSPKSKNSPETIRLADKILNRVQDKLREAAGQILKRVQAVLQKPEVKQAGKAQIREKAKVSILEMLHKAQEDTAQQGANRKKQKQRKQDMEL